MKKIFTQPGTFFLVFGLIIGIAFSVLTPFGTGFDEDIHLARVYDISGLNLLPNNSIYEKSTVSFAEFYTLSYRRFLFRDQAFDLFKPEYFKVRANYDSMDIKENASLYPPLMFFPQAVMAGIFWRFLDLPIIPVSILIRITGLLVYLLISYVAIRILPAGKWGLAVLALLPTALYQASTVNGDGYTNAVSFLFISLVLALIMRPALPFTGRRLLGLCTAIFLVGMAKPGTVVLFLLVLLIPRKAYASRRQVFLLWTTVIAMTLFHAAWLLLVFTNTSGGNESLLNTIGTVSNRLSEYLSTFGYSFLYHARQLFASMIASYGYWIGKVPALVYWIIALIFAAILLVDEKIDSIPAGVRVSLFLILLVSWFGILVLYTSGKFSNNTAQPLLEMVQGRYLVAFLPLLFFSLFGIVNIPNHIRRITQILIPIGTVFFLLLFFWGMFAHYYTACGPFLLNRSNCRLPAYQNLDEENPEKVSLAAGTTIDQEFTNTCKVLRNFQVLTTGVGSGTTGLVRLSLLSENGQELSSSVFDTSLIQTKRWLTLDLQHIPLEKNRDYVFQIEGVDLEGNVGIAIRGQEAYPGTLRVNNDPVVGDLVFYYSCAPVGLFGY